MPDVELSALRTQFVNLLRGGQAHLDFDKAIRGLSTELRGKRPRGLPYSPWQLLEHMRIAQWDILDFCRNREYQEMNWPDDYWPATEAPPSDAAWDKSVRQFRADLKSMEDLVADESTDLFAKIPWGDGQNVLREALLVADHNSYHLGELLVVRRLLGAWKE
jgi:hypothetical protein